MGVKLTAAQIRNKNKRNLQWQAKKINDNIAVVGELISIKAAKLVAMIANDLLGNTLPMTPYDTGKLRASGTAMMNLGGKPIIVGKADSSFPYEVVDAQIPVITSNDMKRVKKVSAVVYFNRRNEEGKDIALWAHENLLPWVPRPKPSDLKGVPVVTKKFTGPKYLENAFNIRKMEYKRALQNISKLPDLESDIKALSRVMQRRRTHYEVDVVELVGSKLTSLGLNVGIAHEFAKPEQLGRTVRGSEFDQIGNK